MGISFSRNGLVFGNRSSDLLKSLFLSGGIAIVILQYLVLISQDVLPTCSAGNGIVITMILYSNLYADEFWDISGYFYIEFLNAEGDWPVCFFKKRVK